MNTCPSLTYRKNCVSFTSYPEWASALCFRASTRHTCQGMNPTMMRREAAEIDTSFTAVEVPKQKTWNVVGDQSSYTYYTGLEEKAAKELVKAWNS